MRALLYRLQLLWHHFTYYPTPEELGYKLGHNYLSGMERPDGREKQPCPDSFPSS